MDDETKLQLTNLVYGLSGIIGVMVTSLIKRVTPSIPKVFLPMIPMFVGTLAEFILQQVGNPTHGWIAAMLVGAAGTGLREVADQLGKSFGGPGTTVHGDKVRRLDGILE